MLGQFVGIKVYYCHVIVTRMWDACHIYANAQCCSIDQYYPIQLNTPSFTMLYMLVSCITVVF